MRSVQAWVCLGILHHRADEEPWSSSRRRRLLVRLAFGIEDWVTEAALFALVTAAWVNPAVRPDVAAIVRQRLSDAMLVSRYRAVSIIWSLAHLAMITPELDAEARGWAGSLLESPQHRGPAAIATGPRGLLRRLIRRR